VDWRKRQLQTALEDVAHRLEVAADESWIEFEDEDLVVLTAKEARYIAYVATKTVEWISKEEGERTEEIPIEPDIEMMLHHAQRK
jgi:hypothetical protein